MKTTEQNQLLLDKIYRACCQINNTTTMNAHFEIMGHVSKVTVIIRESRLSPAPILDMDAYYYYPRFPDYDCVEPLKQILSKVTDILLNLGPVTQDISHEA